MTLEQVSEFYSRAVIARLDYMTDIRMAVWSESDDLEKYYEKITSRR